MGKFFDMDAPVMRFLSRVGELMILSALWLVCCCGVITAGAACAALCRAVFDMRADKPCGPGVFFRAFRDNFKHATVLWLVVLLAAAALVGLYCLIALVANEIARLLALVAFSLLFFLASFFAVYAFPLTAYFENTLAATAKNALAMALGNLKKTIPACALVMLPAVSLLLLGELWFGLLVFWMFLAPGAIAWGVTGLLGSLFRRYGEEENGISASNGQ